MLSEKFVRTKLFRVNNIDERICILWKTRSEYNKFVVFMHSFKEWRHSRSNKDEDVTNIAFNFHWENNVWVINWLERRVDESLIQIKYQGFLTNIFSSLRSKKIRFILRWLLIIVDCGFSLPLVSINAFHRFRSMTGALNLLPRWLSEILHHYLGVLVLRDLAHELIELRLTNISLLMILLLGSLHSFSFLTVLRRIYCLTSIHPTLNLGRSRWHDLLVVIVIALAIIDAFARAGSCPWRACS